MPKLTADDNLFIQKVSRRNTISLWMHLVAWLFLILYVSMRYISNGIVEWWIVLILLALLLVSSVQRHRDERKFLAIVNKLIQ